MILGNNFGFEGGSGSGGGSGYDPCFGSFYDTTIQEAELDSPTAMKLNNTDVSCTSGVSIVNDLNGNPTLITVSKAGVYNLQFSAQLYRTAGGSPEDVDIWLRKMNVNVPDSDTKLSMNANGVYLLAAWNWLVNLNVNEYVQIMWAVSNINIHLIYKPENLTTPNPAIPSVIATIQKIS